MKYILTSAPNHYQTTELIKNNGFIELLKETLPENSKVLYITSSPDQIKSTMDQACGIEIALKRSLLPPQSFTILDRMNEDNVLQEIKNCNVIYLAGGHLPTQNAFLQDLRLSKMLKAACFDGLIIGCSAGSMNSAEEVFSIPELEETEDENNFRYFMPGLGITKVNLIPHYQYLKDVKFHGKDMFADIILPKSEGRKFYAIPDGSYLYGHDGIEELFGEAYLIQNGSMEQIGTDGGKIVL